LSDRVSRSANVHIMLSSFASELFILETVTS
jgi:hypothetical protein